MPSTDRRRANHRFVRRAGKWSRAVAEILRLASPAHRVVVVFGTFVSGVLDLVGITMIVPLVVAATNLRNSEKGIVVAIRSAFEQVGLPFEAWLMLTVIVTGLALKAVVSIAVTRYVGEIVARISRDTQVQLIRSLLSARWSYFVRQPVGRLAFATGPEADAAGECFNNLIGVIAALLQAVLFLTIAALLSWQLLLIMLGAALVMIVSFGRLVQHGRRVAKEHRHRVRQRSAKFTDAMIGIKPIRAMGRTSRFAGIFEAEADDIAASARTRVLSGQFAADLQEPIIGSLIAVGFYFAATTLTVPLHDMMLMALLMIRTVGALLPMQRQAERFIQSYDQFRSLKELIRVTDEAREPHGGTATPTLAEDVRFEDVSFGYDETVFLRGIDLEIKAGQITALLGPSGVGKSTIVDLLVGLHKPLDGRVLVDGTDLRMLDVDRWRRAIGYVPQEIVLFHDTVLENVGLYEDDVAPDDVEACLRAAGAWEFVSAMPEGLRTVVGERGHRLSGGQRQRLSIARALLHRPRLLILDEATTGLDPSTERTICARVRDLALETGLTVLAVSHQPAWQDVADTVYRIESGKAVLLRAPADRLTLPAAG